MSQPITTRTPPEIIFVPPPDAPGITRKTVIGITVWCAFVLLVVLIVSLALGKMLTALWLSLLISCGLFVLVAAVISRRMTRTLRATRQSFFERHPQAQDDPTVATLAKAWTVHDRVPKIEDVRTALCEVETQPASDRTCIICYGETDVPEVGDLHFEPEIITPTGTIWRQLFWVVIAGALVALILLDYLRLLPAWFPSMRNFIGLAYFLVAGAVVLAVWVWKGMIRPTYIRMAPGLIQVLEYRYSRSRPTIRSYPIEPGTLVYVTRIRKRFVLTLARDDHKAMLHISQMQNPQQRIAQTWQALLSTAPTPPLSDDALIG